MTIMGQSLLEQQWGQLQQIQQMGSCYPNYGYTWREQADISINRCENGFVVTIKGKQYIAMKATDIADLVDQHITK